TRTDSLDDAGRVRARRVGQFGSPIVGVRAQIGVHRVDAGGVNAHEDLVRPRLGCRHFLELEDRGAAILGYADGLHGTGLLSLARDDGSILAFMPQVRSQTGEPGPGPRRPFGKASGA